MAVRGMIFDLDGTICNTLADLAAATNAVLRQYGFPEQPEEAFRLFVGDGARKQLQRAIGQPIDEKQFACMYESYLAYYRTHYLVKTGAYEGLPVILQTLKQQGISLAVVTNKPQEMAVHIVQEVFGDLFAMVRGNTAEFALKPDPTLTKHVMDCLLLTPDETLFVGDSAVDIQTAHNCGLRAVGVSWGFRGREELTKAGADVIVDTPAQLLSLID